jgi:hypothetical protein
MFESDERQAKMIANVSGKIAIVPATGQIFRGEREVASSVKKYRERTTRNLMFHCCPLMANDGWRKNIDQIVKHIDIFNGKRVVAIATGGPMNKGKYETHDEDVVRDALKGHGIKFISVPNDHILRERVSFVSLLLEVSNENSNEATFYAHSKGIATDPERRTNGKISNRELGAIRWRNVMYDKLLGGYDYAMGLLRSKVCIGTTQIASVDDTPWIRPSRIRYGTLHFAGTFFWFRHDAIFGDDRWREVPGDHYGVEAWLGGFIPIEDSFSMYQPWEPKKPWSNCMYDPKTYGGEYDD